MKKSKKITIIIIGIYIAVYLLYELFFKWLENSLLGFVLAMFGIGIFFLLTVWGIVNSISILHNKDFSKQEKVIWSGLGFLPTLFFAYIFILDMFSTTISNGR